jgi:hypothetical protein
MKTFTTFALALTLGLAACGGGGDVGTAKKLKDKMCACTDQKCYDDVQKESKAFEETIRGKYKSPDDLPKELIEVGMDFEKCKHDLRRKLRESASPDATKPAGDATKPAGDTPKTN